MADNILTVVGAGYSMRQTLVTCTANTTVQVLAADPRRWAFAICGPVNSPIYFSPFNFGTVAMGWSLQNVSSPPIELLWKDWTCVVQSDWWGRGTVTQPVRVIEVLRLEA